jgi:hypothetical protein
MRKLSLASTLVALIVIAGVLPSFAFKIQPEATDLDGKVRKFSPSTWGRYFGGASALAIEMFTNPVHERVVHHIYGCIGDRKTCSDPEKPHQYASDAVIAGARWNDNPPFELESSKNPECVGKTLRLPNFSKCWYVLFKDAEGRAKAGEIFDTNSGAAFLYRVHFGDLQFLHAMGARDGERAGDTLTRMNTWAEFTYRVALGEIAKETELRKVGISGMDELFRNRGWTVQQMFTRGDPTYRSDKGIKELAFGSLLHMLADSFVNSHADRDDASGAKCSGSEGTLKPGLIRSFHSYAHQDATQHGKEDGHDALDRSLLTQQPHCGCWESREELLRCEAAVGGSPGVPTVRARFAGSRGEGWTGGAILGAIVVGVAATFVTLLPSRANAGGGV